jgi:6-phosphogluconolactonase (cycloisomerase 2 family)
MPNNDMGTKHCCRACGTRYYDLKKPDPKCPKCGSDQRDPAAFHHPSRPLDADPPDEHPDAGDNYLFPYQDQGGVSHYVRRGWGLKDCMRRWFVVACGAALVGCGGSSSQQQPTLVSISVSPVNAPLLLGTNQQFTASGKLTDGSTQDLTQSVAWSSSDSTVLRVNNSSGRAGVGNTRGPGTATITAVKGSVTGTTTVSVTRRTPKFLYAANLSANNVSAFSINPANGVLSQVSGSPFATTTGSTSIAVTRDFKFLYSADFGLNQISAFSVNADGSLKPVSNTPFAAGNGPVSIVAHPAADFLYVSNQGSGEVLILSVNATTGALSRNGSVQIGNSPMFSTMTPDGARFYQTVTSLAQIAAFSASATNGALSPVTGSPFSTGFFPRTLTIDPAGKFLCATISSSFQGTSTSVFAYSIDLSSGALTAVPGSPFTAGQNPVAAAVDPSGRFLFVANNAGNSVSAFSIDPDTGVLTPVSGSPFAALTFPLFVAADPSGMYVYVGTDSGGVLAFAMNQSTGALTPIGSFPGSTVSSIATTY